MTLLNNVFTLLNNLKKWLRKNDIRIGKKVLTLRCSLVNDLGYQKGLLYTYDSMMGLLRHMLRGGKLTKGSETIDIKGK